MIIGGGYKYKQSLKKSNIDIFYNQNNLAKFLNSAHAAVLSAGITLYEALACKVPCIVLPQNITQQHEALFLEKKSYIQLSSKQTMIRDIDKFIRDGYSLRTVKNKLQDFIDLKAPKRIVDVLERNLFRFGK